MARTNRWLAGLLTPIALAVSVVACSKGAAPAPAGERYSFRAEIVKLPDASHARPQVTLRHEAIPDFKDQGGAVVGMDSMVMPFDVAGAPFAGMAVGDKVAVELVADWSRPSFRIVSATRLSPDTQLDFASRGKRP